MNKIRIIFLFAAGVVLTQCRVYREVVKPEAPPLVGMEGLREVCKPGDTIRNVLIRKAESLIITEKERYEASITLYVVRDSMIYLSAVNSGFEILRASMDHDTIRVIDRLNKIVYRTPVKKRFGYQHPVGFDDVQNIVNVHFVCDDLHRAFEQDFSHIVFDFDDSHIKKRISFGRESLKMEKFEFYHTRTNKYFMGEKDDGGFKIFTNFMIGEFEIQVKGGTSTYNQEIPVKMNANPRRYSLVNL